MKKIIIAIVLTLILSLTAYALPEVYEIPMTVDYPVDCWGVFQVPVLGTRSPLYKAPPSEWQDVVDAENSALYQRYSKGYAIYDHAGSELNSGHFWNVEEMQVGCAGFLCREGKPEICYECTAIFLAQQAGSQYKWRGTSIALKSTEIMCVSCAEEDGWVYLAVFEYIGEMP